MRVGEERLGEDAGHPGHGVVARLRAELAAVRAHAADDDAARLPETGSGGIGPHRCRSPLLRTQIVRPFRAWLTFDHG